MNDVEFYSLYNWGQLILVESSILNNQPSIVFRNSAGFEIGRASAIESYHWTSFVVPDSVPFDKSEIYLAKKVFLNGDFIGMGIGKILYQALARACRKVNPSSVLCPFDIVHRSNPEYVPGKYNTSLAALKCWKSMGKDWI